jgi:hypothetical protein
MYVKSGFLTSVILLSYLVFFGQTNFPYDLEWRRIDSLMTKKNLPQSAMTEVNKVYAAAKKDKEEAQWVRAIIYRNHFQETLDQDINEKIRGFESEISSAPPAVASLLKSIEAEELFQYLQSQRYRFRNRSTITVDTSTDIASWSMDRLTNKISGLYRSSLDNLDLSKKTSLENFNAVLISGNLRELRPTLFDLLAWRALDYFKMDINQDAAISTDDQLAANPALFSEAPFFMHYGFSDKDSLSIHLMALKLYQRLLRFHTKDVRLDAWIDADISRIQFVYQIAQMPDKDSLYLNALKRITGQFGTLSASSKAWFLQAQWWYDQGEKYDPLKDTLNRFDFIKAATICEQVLEHPDSSEGKFLCGELLETIRKRSISLNVEQINIPDLPFRVLVSYKNADQLYGRIIQIDDALKESFDQNYDLKFWHKLIKMPVERNFHQQIPGTGDYQRHRVEIGIDGLHAGQYLLLVSSDAAFSDSASMIMTTFFCSNIAFVKNEMDYFVVDRDSGHPLKSVNVKSFIQQFNKGHSVFQLLKTFQTDQNGYFHLSYAKTFSNQVKLEFSLGKDYLSNTQYLYFTRRNENESRISQKITDDIFTDRSIYRPGQIVYFKGLLIKQDLATGRYRAVSQQKSKIFLLDVNDQKIDSLQLKSNEYGSIQGNFRLPQNLLNGEFRIFDEQSESEKAFSVEEYKRPSFYVTYDTLQDSYKVGDSIRLSGSVLAYAGNTIAGGKLVYRVFRESRFPYPWMFRYYPSNTEVALTHGESLTDVRGKFNIGFIAQPDKSVSKSTKPIYTYRIESTLTDLNGESRSASTSVSVSYQSFEISSGISDESNFLKDSLHTIRVTTTNAAGAFVKEKLTVSFTNLITPSRLIRKRYWDQPDQFIMSETDFVKSFPNDEYRNESDVKSWKTGTTVYSHSDSTTLNGLFQLDKKAVSSIDPGWYLIEFRSKDLDGEEIMDKKYVEISDHSGRSSGLSYNKIKEENKTGEPGTSLKIQTGSDANDLFVIRSRQGPPDSALKYSYYTLDRHINNSTIDISENDRGGVSVNDFFVKNNRWFSSLHNIIVPWTNKDLHITYGTWNDKVKPGSREQWKIKISGYRRDVIAAEVLTAMYDASLDQFKEQFWTVPDIYPVYNRGNSWSNNSNFSDAPSRMRPDQDRSKNTLTAFTYDALINFNEGASVSGVRMMSALGANASFSNDLLVKPGIQGYVKFKGDKNEMPESERANFISPKIVKDEEVRQETKPTDADNMSQKNDAQIRIRKNFNETAFFRPDLKTDAQGNVEINFTMPDAMTKWKWMVLANTKDLSFGYSEKFLVSQNELMLQTNMPRFFREGDSMLLPVKIANLSSQSLSGMVRLEWMDASNNMNVDTALGNISSVMPFNVSASQSGVVFFPAIIPAHFDHPILYRISASANTKGASYSDGEENVIPVLSNRVPVTESLPLNMDGQTTKHFRFEKLISSRESASLQNQSLTVEYTTNPVWYAIQSLPYIMEFPYECSEQTFNRFYANALANHIVQIFPVLQSIFEKWKNVDTAALLSNLQKNEELKSVLLRETPWVLQAQDESVQKRNLAILFNMIRMRTAIKSAFDKLQQMQSESGGFAWFKGGIDDRYITQYIISGIGKLITLKAMPDDLRDPLMKMARTAIAFLDREINSDYERRDKSATERNLDPIQIQYLYMRSFFPDVDVPGNIFNALNYYRKISINDWPKQSVYMQGMIALFLSRTGDIKTAHDILASLNENSIHSGNLGMYWKSVIQGYYWQESPAETQSLLIEAFQELQADQKTIDQMKFWLLQQKRTTNWATTKATADACYALLLNGTGWISSEQTVNIQLGEFKISSNEEKAEAGTGYFKKQIAGKEIVPEMGNIEVSVHSAAIAVNGQRSAVIGQPPTGIPSWGAVYWQYFENPNKITITQTQLSISRNVFIEKNSDKGTVLEAVSEKNSLKPGDRLKIRVIIKTDRDLEYVHLKDMRAACLEPASILSGFQRQDGLGYYQTTKDASTSFFFDRLSRGTFVLEYPVFVTSGGNYSNGISTLECMYAPEFAAHSEGIRLHVESK